MDADSTLISVRDKDVSAKVTVHATGNHCGSAPNATILYVAMPTSAYQMPSHKDLLALVAQLRQENATLKARVAALEAELSRARKNSCLQAGRQGRQGP